MVEFFQGHVGFLGGVTFGELHEKNPPNLKTTFFLGGGKQKTV